MKHKLPPRAGPSSPSTKDISYQSKGVWSTKIVAQVYEKSTSPPNLVFVKISQKEQLFKGIHLATSSWISWRHDKGSKASWMTVLVVRCLSWNLVMFCLGSEATYSNLSYLHLSIYEIYLRKRAGETPSELAKDQYIGIYTSYIYSMMFMTNLGKYTIHGNSVGNLRWETVLLAMAMGTLDDQRSETWLP